MSMLEAPAAGVEAYAAAVRRALADLTPDQVDDLTDDLEVALADALADDHRGAGATLADLLGTPEAYAAELRSAAGLAKGSGARRRVSAGDATDRLRAAVREVLAPLRAQPWWPGLAAFVRTLAPAWWVARGWACYAIVASVLGVGIPPRGLFSWLVLLAFVVTSAQWGRGLWLSHPLLRAARWCASAVGIVLIVPLLGTYGGAQGDGSSSYPVYPSAGVWVDGRAAQNLFVYDADGKPVPGAQVFDDDGRPVLVGDDDGTAGWTDQDGNWVDAAPAVSADGRAHWNAYPLRGASAFDPDAPADEPAPVTDPAWPFAQAGAILLPAELTTPTPSPTGDASAAAPKPTSSQPAESGAAESHPAESPAASAPAPTPAG